MILLENKMRYMIPKREFDKQVLRCIPRIFGEHGFSESDPAAFTQYVDRFSYGFGFTLHSVYPQFMVSIGMNVPCIQERMDHINKNHYPALVVYHRLGELRNEGKGCEQWYSFQSDDAMEDAFETAHADFKNEALPWFETFTSLNDVVDEFFRRRIGPPSTGEQRDPDPFAWAFYGWMLEELGKADESCSWFTRAVAELEKPVYMKNGRLVSEWWPGAVLINRSDQEQRLLDLLKQR